MRFSDFMCAKHRYIDRIDTARNKIDFQGNPSCEVLPDFVNLCFFDS